MKVETDRVLAAQEAASLSPKARGWPFAVPAIAAAIMGILVVYGSTAASMLAIWGRSETFAHGYFILPISLALIWAKRRALARMVPVPDVLGFALLAGAGFAWLVAAAGQVQVVQHYAMTAMIPAAVVALAGRRVATLLAFPLGFLLFAVPAGEALLRPMMDFTADFVVAALRLSGIPVYRDGNFFAIPSGQWSVVEACAGLRYLIASATVGAVYAYLNYRRFWKRALFVALSVAVPILANGLRAYMIVLIGHFSDMKLAVGVDHFIYGWVFFGVVILLLFLAGSFWRDPPAPQAALEAAPPRSPASRSALAAAAGGVLLLAGLWPAYAGYLDRPTDGNDVRLESPAGLSGWVREAAPSAGWRPEYRGATASAFQLYRKDGNTVALYVAHYRNQKQGAELIGSQNSLAGPAESPWLVVGETARTEDFGAGPVQLHQTRLRSPAQRLLAWDWYRIAGRDLSNPYFVKALLARDKLLGRGDDAAAIVLAAPYAERADAAEETLRQFARDMLPAIHASLAAVAGRLEP